ncbi:MAG: DUF2520 domain-containing protein [Muribaculaceae bacterium]|nr:DUF2520 domain-containing protein [Muribaculaceae bacterium]
MDKPDYTDGVIAVIGSGNVATHLVKALAPHVNVVAVNSRTLDNFPEGCRIAIISVADRAIGEVAERIAGRAEIIAHTSGSVPMQVLEGSAPSLGVFYPLQTFTKDAEMTYSDIPFFIEGNNPETDSILKGLASLVSDTVIEADSAKRKQLHLASVFACNFSNYLVDVADRILHEKGMDYTLLLPLLRRTVAKLEKIPPDKAQTGPAARKDIPVIEAHLGMLAGTPELQEIYRLLSAGIMDKKTDKKHI